MPEIKTLHRLLRMHHGETLRITCESGTYELELVCRGRRCRRHMAVSGVEYARFDFLEIQLEEMRRELIDAERSSDA